MMLTQADRRPAHLTEVHAALTALPAADQARLGVTEDWKSGPHQLTYRQAERTFGLITRALRKTSRTASPPRPLPTVLDDLLEASIPPGHKTTSASLAADWTDVESFSRPPRHGSSRLRRPRSVLGAPQLQPARPQRRDVLRLLPLGRHDDPRRGRPARPGTDPADHPVLLPRRPRPRPHPRAGPHARRRDPPRRHPRRLRLRPPRRRRLGPARSAPPAPSSSRTCTPPTAAPRAPTHGAIIANGNLYCPATPQPLLHLGPLAPAATPEDTAAHDTRTAELARHKLGRLTADDADGYHRVTCPAATGKLRCPLRPASMTLDRSRPEILTPPEHPPACCTQQTLTIGPDVAAKTRQKHDYPSAAHRRSYARRTSRRTRLLHDQGPRQQHHQPAAGAASWA